MPVNHEVKGMLARLLATEDLVVEHKKVETACFNVHTRVLTLPMWEKASNNVYDLLVSHECGHSIFTPDEDWTEQVKVPPQFVNIVEDARIEKLMKRRYAGLAKTFFNGYKELAEQDFFQIEDEQVDEMNLADRANLYFKIGNFADIFIEPGEETKIINLIADAETFTDVLIASEELYEYCKQRKQEETKINLDSHEIPQSGGNSPASDFSDQPEGENDQPEMEGGDGRSSDEIGEQKSQEQKQEVKGEQGGEKSEPEVKTVGNLEEALKDLVNRDGWENVYVEIPKLNVNQIIVNNVEIHNRCKESWESYLNHNEYESSEIFGEADKEFREFKRSAQKEVNYLVKEFECHKAADSYARASTARTGVLDCSKLHTYKYNEDLFRKVTTLANGKNHGLVFILDWSGSMSRVMLDTVKQLFNLIWFCKKVNIPFEVYAFTNDYPIFKYDENNKPIMPEPLYKKKDGVIQVQEYFSLMNMLTSKTNAKTLEDQMLNIYRISRSFSDHHYCRYAVPVGLSLSGTPLNETLIALHEILPTFQKDNKLQKVQCVILTDGEAHSLKYHKEFHRANLDGPYLGVNSIGGNAFLRDRKTGNTYSLDVEWYGFTDVLLRNLRDKFPTVNFIGMRILEGRDAGSFIRRYTGWINPEYDKIMNTWKKEKTFSIKDSGYHTYFGLSASALANDAEFEVAEDATKTQIKTAFVKSLKSKKMNKKVLGEFVELVA
jgi:ribosomal protein L23